MDADLHQSNEPRELGRVSGTFHPSSFISADREDTRRLLLTLSDSTQHLDLRTAEAQNLIESLSGALVRSAPTRTWLLALHESLVDSGAAVSPAVLLAAKNALSRQILLETAQAVHLSVVVAVFKEHNRMLPRDQHEHGEDFIRVKARQLEWLTQGTRATWSLHFVDDGCPEKSGEKAQAIISSSGISRASVSYLGDGIRAGDPAVGALRSVEESQKGGSILYGLALAAREQREGCHIVLYTDADLSTDLRQAGNLCEDIMAGNTKAAAATRHARGGRFYVGPTGQRANAPTKGFTTYRAFVRECLLPGLQGVTDTQAGFKAIDASLARDLSENISEKGFPFDVEILLRLRLLHEGGFVEVPIVWGDSPEETTTGSLSSHTNQLKGAARIYRKYSDCMGNRTDEHDRLADLIVAIEQPLYESAIMPKLCEIGERALRGEQPQLSVVELCEIAARGSST